MSCSPDQETAGPPPRFIVAEINKNWRDGAPLTAGTLGMEYERMIVRQLARGYVPRLCTLSQSYPAPGCLMETLIAVFEREDGREDVRGPSA